MSTDRWIDMEIVAYVNNGMLLSLKKKKNKEICIWVSLNKVDEPGAYCTEWSKSEEKDKFCILMYMYGILKGGTDELIAVEMQTENRFVDTVWEGKRE